MPRTLLTRLFLLLALLMAISVITWYLSFFWWSANPGHARWLKC